MSDSSIHTLRGFWNSIELMFSHFLLETLAADVFAEFLLFVLHFGSFGVALCLGHHLLP